MRVTIETTNSDPKYTHKVIVEVPGDDLGITEMHQLVWNALSGSGWLESQVKEIMGDYE